MANKRVEDLPELQQIDTGALIYISQSGIPYNSTIKDLIGILPFSSGQGGSVSGVISGGVVSINGISGIINISTSGNLQVTKDPSHIYISPIGPQIYIGSGSPEGILVATSGSLYTDWFNQTFYQKITGTSINGWI